MGVFEGHHNFKSSPTESATARFAASSNVSSLETSVLGSVHRGIPEAVRSEAVLRVRKTRSLSCRSRVRMLPVWSASVSRGAGVNGRPAVLWKER